MSVAFWRRQVSTSQGCKQLFQSKNFTDQLTECLNNLHDQSLQSLQSNTKCKCKSFEDIISLYRTIRNLASINDQAVWIICESTMIAKIIAFLDKIVSNLCLHIEANEFFVIQCDIIRAAFQIFCNLSFHEYANKDETECSVHAKLWSHFECNVSTEYTDFISLWIAQLFEKVCKDGIPDDAQDSMVIQSNLSRVLEPICALLHEFIVHHPDCTDRKEDRTQCLTKSMYCIQLIDVHCFGNNKNYLYQKVQDDQKSADIDQQTQEEQKDDEKTTTEKDDYEKWQHHEWIRKLIPYFINSNGLLFYLHELDESVLKLYYFQVSIELLFEMTESILIDVKVPSTKHDIRLRQQHQVNLIQYVLKDTFVRLISVVHFSMNRVFPAILNNVEHKSTDFDLSLINICQNILETLSNVSLISTSIEDKEEMRQYQHVLMNAFGPIMVEGIKVMETKSEELTKYCKDNGMSEDKFTEKYGESIPKILSFRRQFISIIATLCCNNKKNQDYVRQHGIIELLLNMTKIDRFTMFLQQWSIFAVKHITQNNMENQQYIQQIKAQKVIQNEEMKNLGIQVTYDEITGKLVTKKADAQHQT